MKKTHDLLILMGAVCWSVQAWATSFVDRPFPEVVKESPVMVRGKVGNSYADWGVGSDTNKRIFTFYELQISETLKGSVSGSNLLMREMGGEKDGIGMEVSGASHFDRGEDVVVMLSDRNSDGTYDIRGLMTGKLNVAQNQSGKEILTGPAVQGMEHIAEGHAEGHNDTGTQTEWTLDALREVIRTQGGAPAGAVSAQNSTVAGRSQPHAAPSQKTVLEAQSPAPQLQNSTSEETKNPSVFGFLTWVGLALMGVGIFATKRMWFRRGKR